jgi:hypothetical protein
MTATMTAPPVDQVAPNLITRIKQGDLATPQNALLGAGTVVLAVSWIAGGDRFYFAYLTAYMFMLGICLGGLFFTMLQHITRAGWSVTVRRVAENVMAALPWMLLLFLPIVVGFGDLFHWSHAEEVARDPILQGKSGYLNPVFFFVRVALYFAIWIGLAFWFRRTSIAQDESGDPALSLRMARVAAPGLLLFALSITFAAFDWIMSLDPHWFSTIFGVTYFAGGFMAFLAYVTLLTMWLNRRGYLRDAVNTEHFHDLGKLMFAFMVFWTYVNYSQYMLIWYANLPEETAWYQHRRENGWGAIGTLLIFGHFLVPFAFLMSRHIKRRTATLATGAAFLLVMHWIDMHYLILPNMAHATETAPMVDASRGVWGPFASDLGHWAGHHLHWTDFTALASVILLVTGLVLVNVRKSNLVPVRDPRLPESLAFLNH